MPVNVGPWRLTGGVVLGALLLVAAAVATTLWRDPAGSDPPTPPARSHCQLQPCADYRGYTVSAGGLVRSGSDLRLSVRLVNGSQAQQETRPTDFSLKDAAGKRYTVAMGGDLGCPAWPRTDLAIGADLGPQPLCFHLPRGAEASTLIWSPDLGLLIWVRMPIPLSPLGQTAPGH